MTNSRPVARAITNMRAAGFISAEGFSGGCAIDLIKPVQSLLPWYEQAGISDDDARKQHFACRAFLPFPRVMIAGMRSLAYTLLIYAGALICKADEKYYVVLGDNCALMRCCSSAPIMQHVFQSCESKATNQISAAINDQYRNCVFRYCTDRQLQATQARSCVALKLPASCRAVKECSHGSGKECCCRAAPWCAPQLPAHPIRSQ